MSTVQNQTKPPFADFTTPAGARFHRADLHVHSFAVSPDVKDVDMTVPNIVAKAQERGIGLLAITDHNAIDAVDELIIEGERQGVAVIAGVELSTADGHVLVYFDPRNVDNFKKWFAKLDFEEESDRNERWLLKPIQDLAKDVEVAGGIAIPAHVARSKSGCLDKATSKTQDAIIASPAICAIEVDGHEEFDWFSAEDKSAGYKRRREQMDRRLTALGEVAGSRLPKLYFSDAHRLDQLGRNRNGEERLTRVKMTEPSFTAFLLALRDPEARIRIEEQLPESYSRLVGARFVGGFLDEQEIAFSPNLTCLIGGRGAGKSTALEAVRGVCLNSHHDREVKSDPEWPNMVQLIYEDHFGERHYIQRTVGEKTLALTDDEAIECTIPIEGYAQDRVAEIIRGYGTDADQLGAFLDAFADIARFEERIAELRAHLRVNAESIVPVQDALGRRKAAEDALAEVQLKLKAVEKSNLKKALEVRRRLIQERQLRKAIEDRLGTIQTDIAKLDVDFDVEALASMLDAGDLKTTPSKKYLLGDGKDLEGLVKLVTYLQTQLRAWKKGGETKLAQVRPSIDSTINEWQSYDQRVEARYQQIITKLREENINPDVKQLTKLTDAETKAKQEIYSAKLDEIALAKLRRERKKLLAEYKSEQAARFYERQQATRRLTGVLNKSIREFKVKLTFVQGDECVGYERWLRDALGNRFFRSERISSFCRQLHPIELTELIARGARPKLVALEDDKGKSFFGTEVDEFMDCMRTADLMELETIDVSDAPAISLTTKTDGKIRTVAFEHLSFGQKASILLGALLCSNDTTPLIIDQPEDHLDSAFIYETIVSTLRNVKEQRQVILATHNANIAVLGDAELIVPLQSYGNVGRIREAGAVDASQTRDRACKILEGGAAAYERRGEMYGLRADGGRG
jgi:DNA repair ATPase RecN